MVHPKLGVLSENESWLIHCSCSDVNWKTHLKDASLKEIDRVLSVETRITATIRLKVERKRKLNKLLKSFGDFKKRAKMIFNSLIEYYDEHKGTVTITDMEIEKLIDFKKVPMEEFGRVLTITIEHEPVQLKVT